MSRKLTKVKEGKKICGVCTGFAKYIGCDVTWIRLALALFTLAGGAGIIGYIACAIILPEDPVKEVESVPVEKEEEPEKIEEN